MIRLVIHLHPWENLVNKLTLDPETLRVQTFAAAAETGAHHDAAARTRPHICDPVTAWC